MHEASAKHQENAKIKKITPITSFFRRAPVIIPSILAQPSIPAAAAPPVLTTEPTIPSSSQSQVTDSSTQSLVLSDDGGLDIMLLASAPPCNTA